MMYSLPWVLPFVGILLSLSTVPLIAKSFWHHHYGKIILALSLLFVVPAALYVGPYPLTVDIFHLFIKEYFPFLSMVGALFVVTSGIRIKATWIGAPAGNTGILFLGTILSSLIGTTGASMVLIRPILEANSWRKHKAHTVIFFIFLVANIGGALSPMGDAPLFLGFLEGVPFFWPLKNLFGPTFLSVSYLLVIFFGLDFYLFRKEKSVSPHLNARRKVKVNGKINLFFLSVIILTLLLTTFLPTERAITLLGTEWLIEDIIRDIIFIVTAILSFNLTKKGVRSHNHFTWEPLIEVAKIFAGIFVTMLPLLSMLKGTDSGILAPLVSSLNHHGAPNNSLYFWITGFFSSFLDNAPSYLIFFNMAGGSVSILTSTLNQTLIAISLGSVYMGAMTYIGNAPNFMIRAIAEQQGISMPSFFSYTLISIIVLIPLFLGISYIYFY